MPDLLLTLLPADLSLWTAGALVASSFVTSAISAAFGLGGGLVMLALLAATLPPAALIPVHGWVQLGSNVARAAMMWRNIQWALVPGFVIGTVAGVALGGQIVVSLPPAYMQLAVGLFILWTLLETPPRWLRYAGWLSGLVSSFLTMFFGATGPFVAAYLKPRKMARHDQVATHAMFMTFQHGLKVAMFGFLGFALAPWIGFILALVLSGVAGTWAGKLILSRMSDRGFHRVLSVVLALVALRLVYMAGRALLAG
ncbi:MAG: sulfite exporter TauE/SafE family protein [Pseudomonadota bacterium]|nr:sulfite exporter TauE/SafE family protein [Pseudomonadota bacterium]